MRTIKQTLEMTLVIYPTILKKEVDHWSNSRKASDHQFHNKHGAEHQYNGGQASDHWSSSKAGVFF